jgi:hypothetical protein
MRRLLLPKERSMKSRTLISGMTLFATTLVGTFGGTALHGGAAAIAATPTAIKFKVRIENTTAADAFTASNGMKWSLGFSPGAWAVHTTPNPIFTVGKYDRGQGLESQSEDGNPDTLVASLQREAGVKSSGIFNLPMGMTEPGPIRPGNAYEFSITATPGERLSLTMMFGQSNDWFYAPEGGIPLFDAQSRPISGDVTKQIGLWDVGTEVDQEPGIGPDQGPRQKAANTGEAEHVGVNPIVGYAADSVMRVTITPQY